MVATGRATELGRIATLTESVKQPRTSLQLQMRQLAAFLLWVALAFSVVVPALGVLLARRPVQEMLLTGLTLAFATIPEELPILITIVLGLGAHRLARERAIVKRLRGTRQHGVAGGSSRSPGQDAPGPSGYPITVQFVASARPWKDHWPPVLESFG